MGVADARDPHLDVLCEICGSSDFGELLCQCCQCKSCNEHVFCMLQNIPYIPKEWTCDTCLLINSVSFEPMHDTSCDDVEEMSYETYQTEVECNCEDPRERVPLKVPIAVGRDSHLEELGKKTLTEAFDIIASVCYYEEQGKKVALEASGNSYHDSHSEGHGEGVTVVLGASDDIHLDAPSKRGPLKDSFIADFDQNSESRVNTVAQKALDIPDSDLNSDGQKKSLGDAESDSHFAVHVMKVSPREACMDFSSGSVKLGKIVLSDTLNADQSNSHLVEIHKISPPAVSGHNNDDSHESEQIREVPPISYSYSAEQGNKVAPNFFNYSNTQPQVLNSVDALSESDMRLRFKADKERLDNLASKMKHFEAELQTLFKKIDKAVSKKIDFPGMEQH